jgi:hypothetical protein
MIELRALREYIYFGTAARSAETMGIEALNCISQGAFYV